MLISEEGLASEDVRALLSEHLAEMRETSPPESVHALDHGQLAEPGVTFWVARDSGLLLGCGALKELPDGNGEIKSMRTARAARRRGVAARLLVHMLTEAGRRGYRGVYLETGSQEHFAPARELYGAHGFVECPPFGDYRADPNSVFMMLELSRCSR